jgi:HlyD family secretion protein
VKVGQPAAVTVEALGETFAGDVVKIDPRASKIGGDVVYKVTIALAEPPSGLRWGMSAKVTIGP